MAYLLGRFSGRFLVVSTIAIFVSFVPILRTETAQAQESFIERNGTKLTLDGAEFTFTGINIYNANSDGTCGAVVDLNQALTSIGSGKAVIRAWFFQNMATTIGSRDWSRMDQTLAIAAAHGVKVIPVLGNQWADCDTGYGFKTKTWYQSGYQATDPAGTMSYRDWVADVVARYKDNPTVAFWQLINEAEVQDVEFGDCSQVTDAAETLRVWAQDVAGLIKTIDTNHLVSLGTIGGGQCGTEWVEYEYVHSIPEIDLCEYHDYGSPFDPLPGDDFNGFEVRVDQCVTNLGKPLFVGEAGITVPSVGSLEARAGAFTAKIDAQLEQGAVGYLAWAYFDPPAPSTFDIGPGDPTLDVLDLAQPRVTDRYTGLTGDPALSPSFVVATAAQSTQVIDFDGDGFDSLAAHTFTPIPSGHYAALGVTMIGLDARSVGSEAWAHSPPIGAWATGFSAPTSPYSFVFDEPQASFGAFVNDVEGPVAVTLHLATGAREWFTLASQGGANVGTFFGFVSQVNLITQVDIYSADYHIIDDLLFGRVVGGDFDGDGISDSLDEDPLNPSTRFFDGDMTFGELLANSTGEPFMLTDLAGSEGIRIVVGGTSGQLSARLCGSFTVDIAAGSDVSFSCGSITIAVSVGGPVVVTPDGDGIASVSIPAGVTASVSTPVNDQFWVEHLGGAGTIAIVVAGVESNLGPGSPPGYFTSNAPPTIDAFYVPLEPVSISQQPIQATIEFSDQGPSDSHTCYIDWGDESSETLPMQGMACMGTHSYGEPGVYTITGTVTDDAGDSSTTSSVVVVYDPTGGFVTGGGWFESPPGAYADDPSLVGKATFGFVAKYKKGASTPSGNTEFQFKAGGLNFHSDSYQWLVVSGNTRAVFKGSGTINQTGSYSFMLWAQDATPDKFRIKIWTETSGVESIVYDNGSDEALGGGAIVIKTK